MKVKVSKAKLWKAIRDKCKDCVCGAHKLITDCNIETCSLWEYRFGKAITEDQDDNDS